VTPEELTGIPLSAHNSYLQIWLQLGIVGFILQSMLLAGLLLLLFKRRNRVSRVGLAVLLGLMVRDVFEVTLIQNNAPLEALIWLVIGIGVSARHVVDQIPRTVPARGERKATVEARI
jgi:O-antigen ligase